MNKLKKESMKCRKLFFSMMMVALAATMCVVFTACSKDDEVEHEVDYSGLILGLWECRSYNFQENMLETQGFIEFKTNNTYFYESLTENYEGNYRITESERTKYMRITESYLKVDSTITYYEYKNGIQRTWEIVDGTIIYIDSTSLLTGSPANDEFWLNYYASDSYMNYIVDTTVIVPDTAYYDAGLNKMLISGSSDFDQLRVYYIMNQSWRRLVVEFYSRYELLKTVWYNKPGDLK